MKQVAGFYLPNVDTYFGPFLEEEGGFQLSHLEGALRYVTDFSLAIDGGAHIGTWSLEMARHFTKVYAFEPARDTFGCLSANCLNKNVVVFPVALSNYRGKGKMLDSVTRIGNTGARFLAHGDDVDVVTIDSLTLPTLGFLKLDVEGSELFALQGAEETLLRCRPVVLIEEKRFKDTAGRIPVDHKAAGQFLVSLGMQEAARFRNDVVYIWR